MEVIYLPDTTQYHDIYALSGITPGTTLVIHNKSSDVLFVTESAAQPVASSVGHWAVETDETVLMHANGLTLWAYGAVGPLLVQKASERTVTPFGSTDLPHDLYTGPKELYRRIKVDPGQTSFHDGREFRAFVEFSIPANSSLFLQAIVTVDTILYGVTVEVDQGGLRMNTLAGGTVTTPFVTDIPVIRKNTMSIVSQPVYPTTISLKRGGVVTGGTVIDTLRVVAAGSNAQRTTVGSGAFDQRGIGAGTYYWHLQNISNATALGVFSTFWAEIINLGV